MDNITKEIVLATQQTITDELYDIIEIIKNPNTKLTTTLKYDKDKRQIQVYPDGEWYDIELKKKESGYILDTQYKQFNIY